MGPAGDAVVWRAEGIGEAGRVGQSGTRTHERGPAALERQRVQPADLVKKVAAFAFAS